MEICCIEAGLQRAQHSSSEYLFSSSIFTVILWSDQLLSSTDKSINWTTEMCSINTVCGCIWGQDAPKNWEMSVSWEKNWPSITMIDRFHSPNPMSLHDLQLVINLNNSKVKHWGTAGVNCQWCKVTVQTLYLKYTCNTEVTPTRSTKNVKSKITH